MADIIQIAEKLNAEVTRLNTERSKLEGKTESARTQYEKAVKAYEVKYGVKLTPENLQSVYNEVYARKLGLAEDLQAQITSINNGDYKKDMVGDVEFELNPDVAPVHTEENKKKSKEPVKKEDLTDLLASADSVLTEPVIEPMIEPVVEPVKKTKKTSEIQKTDPDPVAPPVVEKKGRKPLTGADITAALKQAETIVQKPVTTVEDADLSGFDFGDMGVEKSDIDAKPAVTAKSDDELDLSGFDFGNMGVELDDKSVNPAEPSFGENPNVAESEDEISLENLDFGNFGDVGSEEPTPADDKKQESKDNLESFTFGGLGDLTPDPVKEEKESPKTIEDPDWGADLGNLSFDFGDADVKFG